MPGPISGLVLAGLLTRVIDGDSGRQEPSRCWPQDPEQAGTRDDPDFAGQANGSRPAPDVVDRERGGLVLVRGMRCSVRCWLLRSLRKDPHSLRFIGNRFLEREDGSPKGQFSPRWAFGFLPAVSVVALSGLSGEDLSAREG